jgi:hypothetical protein
MKKAAATGRIADSLQAENIARHAPKFGAIGAIAMAQRTSSALAVNNSQPS